MTKETSEIGRAESVASPKRPWTEPKLEIVKGRDASGSFSRAGGIDYGIYS
jgi:hypothetical protein